LPICIIAGAEVVGAPRRLPSGIIFSPVYLHNYSHAIPLGDSIPVGGISFDSAVTKSRVY
jgi:hypothetical protein